MITQAQLTQQNKAPLPGISPILRQTPVELAHAALAQFQTPQEKQKNDWISQAQQLNPNVDAQTIGKIYDEKVIGHPALAEGPSVQNQLDAMIQFQKHLDTTKPPAAGEDEADKEPQGFDTSDKMSMIGSMYHAGKMGLEEGLARTKQLGLQLAEDAGLTTGKFPKSKDALFNQAMQKLLVKPEASKTFTEDFNRSESRNKLFQQAMQQHPIAGAIAKFGGSILPSMAVPEQKLASGIEDAATKMGAQKIFQNLPKWLGRAGAGAMIGHLQYDPTAQSSTAQDVGGALANLALPLGGKLIKKMGKPVWREVEDMAQRYGIRLPVYTSLEKLAGYVPFTGAASRAADTAEQIVQRGRELGQSIIKPAGEYQSYGDILHGEMKNAYGANQKKVGTLEDKIAGLAAKGKRNVKLDNLRGIAQNVVNHEMSLQGPMRDQGMLDQAQNLLGLKNDSYMNTLQMKRRLGSLYNKVERGSYTGAYTPEQLGNAKRMYGAISDDMNNYAGASSKQIQKLNNDANQLYKDKVLPFKKGGRYAKLLAPDYDTDNFIGHFLRPDKAQRASDMLDMMPSGSERGINAARAAVIHSALEKADIPGAGFNAEKFISEALRLKKANNVVFSPLQLDSLQGYQKLINLTKRLSPNIFGKGKEFRHLLGHAGGISAVLWHPHIVLPLLLGGNFAARILTSDTGRKALAQVARLSEKASQKQVNPLLANILKIGAIATGAKLSQELT